MKISQLFFLLAIIFVSACAKNTEIAPDDISTAQNQNIEKQNNTQILNNDFYVQEVSDDYFDDDYDEYAEEPRRDTFKYWNKFWFHINDFFLLKIAKPVYHGYEKIVPAKIRSGFTNFRYNLGAPVRMTNAALQAEFDQFFVEFGKFMINSMTSLGFADVASQNEILVLSTPEQLRFGTTLAKWGFAQGPYFILPFFGPSTIREGFGLAGDFASSPQRYFMPWEASLFTTLPLEVNNLGTAYRAYEAIVTNSIDPYISLRTAYLERLNYLDAQLKNTAK